MMSWYLLGSSASQMILDIGSQLEISICLARIINNKHILKVQATK